MREIAALNGALLFPDQLYHQTVLHNRYFSKYGVVEARLKRSAVCFYGKPAFWLRNLTQDSVLTGHVFFVSRRT